MPELPDVEIFRRHLASTSLHRPVAHVRVRDSRALRDVSAQKLARTLRGQSLERTHRHGKHLLVDLSDGGVIALHFGMTGYLQAGSGQTVPRRRSQVAVPRREHVRVLLEFEDGHWLAHVDQRRLGFVAVGDGLDEYVARMSLGPDALTLSRGGLRTVLKSSRGSVKGTFMDQARIAGLGNIYTDEVLFQARVDPKEAARQLDDAAYGRLHRQIQRVCALAVERQAQPDRMPRTWLLPHREDGALCPRGNGTVRRFSSGGRAGYWCPACQSG